MYTKIISGLCVTSIALVLASSASAHELTPTYVEPEMSYMDGISKAVLTMFNRREDVRYYEIELFDSEFNNIEFAAASKILEIEYTQRKTFEVYFKSENTGGVPTFICTTSKLEKENQTATMIESRVCSKIK
jgi:hypothetical protein